jgi:hypothetical protein
MNSLIAARLTPRAAHEAMTTGRWPRCVIAPPTASSAPEPELEPGSARVAGGQASAPSRGQS